MSQQSKQELKKTLLTCLMNQQQKKAKPRFVNKKKPDCLWLWYNNKLQQCLKSHTQSHKCIPITPSPASERTLQNES